MIAANACLLDPLRISLFRYFRREWFFKEIRISGDIRGSVSSVFFGQIMQLGSGAGGNGGSGSLRN